MTSTTTGAPSGRRPPNHALRTLTMGELLAHPFPRREFLLDPWLRQGQSVMLWAPTGLGKTMLALTLALAVAGGGEVLGWHAPTPRKVLWVDGEMHTEDLRDRVAMLADTIPGLDREAAAANLLLLPRQFQDASARFPDLAEAEAAGRRQSGQDAVLAVARQHDADLIVLDNFSTLAEVADENEAAAMSPVLSFLLRLKQDGRACILVHHSGKSGVTYRGSSKLATTFEIVIGLTAPEGHHVSDGAAFTLEWTKWRGPSCAAVRDRLVRLATLAGGRREWTAEATPNDDARLLAATVRECVHTSQDDIGVALGWSKSKVSKVKGKMFTLGLMNKDEFETCLDEARGAANSDY